MSNDAYHQSEGESKSKLDAIAPECGNCPHDYWAMHVNPERPPFEPTPVMILGTAIHAAILEPDSFAAGYIVAPEDAPKRPTERQITAKKPSESTLEAIAFWAEFAQEAAGKTMLDAEDWANVIGARDAVLTHPDIKGFFTSGVAEESYFAIDPETGSLVKCRPDWNRLDTDGIVIDIKSTENAAPEAFGGVATTFRYDVADPFYSDVIDLTLGAQRAVRSFGFVAVERKYPFNVGLYYLNDADRAYGREMGRRDLRRIVECRAKNHWPDFAGDNKAQPLRLRPYLRRRDTFARAA